MLPCALVLLFIAFARANDSIFNLYKHPASSSAKCLDGSPGALYIQQGSGINKNKFLLFFLGGGACGGYSLTDTLQNCYQRALTIYGSSKEYNTTLDLSDAGLLSTNSTLNPNFYDWTRVFMPYCDGAFHQGSRLNPVAYKGLDLYFRGTNVTLAHLQYLRTAYFLSSAPQIVVTGVSAGALATYYWSNYIQDQFKNSKVIAVPDSGIFVTSFVNPVYNFTPPDTGIEMFKLVNTEVQMPMKECVQAYPTQRQCYQAGVLAPFLKVPTFIINSLYDAYTLRNILGYPCVKYQEAASLLNCNITVRLAIQEYRKATEDAILNFTANLNNIGVWAISCSQHVFQVDQTYNSQNYLVPGSTGITASEALTKFLANPSAKASNIHIDKAQWPFNVGCSGVSQMKQKKQYGFFTVQE